MGTRFRGSLNSPAQSRALREAFQSRVGGWGVWREGVSGLEVFVWGFAVREEQLAHWA